MIVREKIIFVSFSICLLNFISTAGFAQTYEQIKSNPDKYIFAEGVGVNVKEAENAANTQIIEQVNVFVSSSFSGETNTKKISTVTSRKSVKGSGSVESESASKSVTETYSQMQLINCRKIVRENGERKRYVIFKYIDKSEISRLFKAREQKVIEYLTIATEAENEMKIDDALKYYSWARYLLSTLLRPNELTFEYEKTRRNCSAWIPAKISQVLDDIDFKFNSFSDKNREFALIDVLYKGKPVSSLDFTYYDGVTWGPMVRAKNGKGAVELRTDMETKFINVQVEYNYENEAVMDPEIAIVMQKADPFQFENAYKQGILIPTTSREIKLAVKEALPPIPEPTGTNNTEMFLLKDPSRHIKNVDAILDAISAKNYISVKHLFTTEGYEVFERLIEYGNARIMDRKNIKFISLDESVFCRSVPMVFSFSNNTKSFVENVVFEFNKDGKVDNIVFALESTFIQDVMAKDAWAPQAKMILVNFLENYKTAFALKRLDYISSIFSDDALIISGRIVKRSSGGDSSMLNDEVVIFTRQTKTQYIDNLDRSFKSKEYINLKFSNIQVRRITRGFNPNIYSVQLRQDYFSSNYGDTGYLFLLVDLADSHMPVIHIRTWQQKPDPEFGVFGPGSEIFNN